MPDLDFFVPFPSATPGTGDTVLYSTRPYVSASSGRPREVGPVQSGERAMKFAFGWFQANQDAIIKVQSWDQASASWVTINNDGNGDSAPAAGGPATVTAVIPQGDFQIVVNFTVAPTTWKHAKKWRLSRVAT